MKKLLCSLGLVLAVTASAQQYSPFTLMSGATTNVVAAGATSNYAAGEFYLPVTKYEDVAVQIRFNAVDTTSGAASNVIVNFAWGPNATTMAATKQFAVALALGTTVTTPVQITTNIYVGSAGYLMLHSINAVNVDGVALTNIVIKVATKPKRFGS